METVAKRTRMRSCAVEPIRERRRMDRRETRARTTHASKDQRTTNARSQAVVRTCPFVFHVRDSSHTQHPHARLCLPTNTRPDSIVEGRGLHDAGFVASTPWSSHRGTKHPLQTHPRTRRTSRTTHAFDPFAGGVSRIDVHDVRSNDAFLVQATSQPSTCRAGLVRPNPSLGTLAHLSARIHALFVSRARTSFDRPSVVRSFACVLGSIDRSIDPQVLAFVVGKPFLGVTSRTCACVSSVSLSSSSTARSNASYRPTYVVSTSLLSIRHAPTPAVFLRLDPAAHVSSLPSSLFFLFPLSPSHFGSVPSSSSSCFSFPSYPFHVVLQACRRPTLARMVDEGGCARPNPHVWWRRHPNPPSPSLTHPHSLTQSLTQSLTLSFSQKQTRFHTTEGWDQVGGIPTAPQPDPSEGGKGPLARRMAEEKKGNPLRERGRKERRRYCP